MNDKQSTGLGWTFMITKVLDTVIVVRVSQQE